MKVNKILLFIFVLFEMTASVIAATVYKWVDSDGQIHYESKPQHKNAKKIKLKDHYINSENAPEPEMKEQVAGKEKKNSVEAKNKSAKEVKRIKREQVDLKNTRCTAAKAQLQRAINSKKLYDLDETGNQILLRKKQYKQAMAQARARVKKWCQ